MEFQLVTLESKAKVLNTKPGTLMRFYDGTIGIVTRSSRRDIGVNDYIVAILSGDTAGRVVYCMHCYDHERVNVEVVEPIKYMEV